MDWAKEYNYKREIPHPEIVRVNALAENKTTGEVEMVSVEMTWEEFQNGGAGGKIVKHENESWTTIGTAGQRLVKKK